MIKQITIDNNNCITQWSIGGLLKNGITVEDIPDYITSSSDIRKYCYSPELGFYENPNYSILILPEIKQRKINEIKSSCENAIIHGTDADVLGRGMLHYSLTQIKQDDIKVLMLNIQNGAANVLWHDDSRVMHEVYSAEQFSQLYNIIFAYIIRCKITSDGLEQYITDCAENGDIETLQNISWETQLPDYIQEQVNQQINLMLGNSNATDN